MSKASNIKRKCSQCSHWNVGDIEYCAVCNHPITAQKIIENHEEVLSKKFAIKRTVLDDILDKMKDHRFLFVRGVYYILYATYTVIMFIVSGILFLIAWTPG